MTYFFLSVFFTYPSRQGMQADQNMMLHPKIIFVIMLGLVQRFVAGTEAQRKEAQCFVPNLFIYNMPDIS